MTPLEEAWPENGLESVNSCPVCGGIPRSSLYENLRDRVFFCAPGKWTLYECNNCRSAYLDPRPTVDSIDLAYRKYFNHTAPANPNVLPKGIRRRWRLALRNGYINIIYGYELKPAIAAGKYLLSSAKKIKAGRAVRNLHQPGHDHARLLDVGCGNGAFLRQMQSLGWIVQGLEPDPASCRAAASCGLNIDQNTLHTHTYPPDSFNAVTMSHVIEHLHDPTASLRQCLTLLKPGGIIWIATPNLSSLGHRRFHSSWIGLDPPRHLVLFTPDSLKLALHLAGFQLNGDLLLSQWFNWAYRASIHLERGEDPDNAPRLPPLIYLKNRIAAKAANRRTRRRPSYTEELVLIARKPRTQPSTL